MDSKTLWLAIGFFGQAMFTMRFLVQWVQSERRRKSVIPTAFWYFSLAGGMILLSYAIHKRDPVFILGQGAGVVIYLRNLTLIRRQRQQAAADPGLGPARNDSGL